MLTALVLLLASPAIAETIAGRASVIDGDTIEVQDKRIRLHGIDAPESSQALPGRRREGLALRPAGSQRTRRPDCPASRPPLLFLHVLLQRQIHAGLPAWTGGLEVGDDLRG